MALAEAQVEARPQEGGAARCGRRTVAPCVLLAVHCDSRLWTSRSPGGYMREHTLTSIARDAGHLAKVAEAAERRGLNVGRLVGMGGHAAVFEAHPEGRDRCVLKVPWSTPRPTGDLPSELPLGHGPARVDPVSPTGPFALRGPLGTDEAEAILRDSCARQGRTGAGRPLALLLDVLDLAGVTVALYERVWGDTLAARIHYCPEDARLLVPRLARALRELHRTFGGHGDLKPAHIYWTQEGPVFIDPLGPSAYIGSVGYALPCCLGADGPDDGDPLRVRDLGALAQILAEMWGGSLGWDGQLVHAIANCGRGRFDRGLDPESVRRTMDEGTAAIPTELRRWTREAAGAVFDSCLGIPPAPGFVATMLDRIAS